MQSFLTLFVEEKSGNIKTFKAFRGEKCIVESKLGKNRKQDSGPYDVISTKWTK